MTEQEILKDEEDLIKRRVRKRITQFFFKPKYVKGDQMYKSRIQLSPWFEY
jgi:hypothetical protein